MTDDIETKKEVRQKKTGSIIVRVSEEERAIIDAKIAEAGYKSASAFIRDYLAREKPKAKADIRPDALEMQRQLMSLSSMISGNAGKHELMSKIAELYRLAISGALT